MYMLVERLINKWDCWDIKGSYGGLKRSMLCKTCLIASLTFPFFCYWFTKVLNLWFLCVESWKENNSVWVMTDKDNQVWLYKTGKKRKQHGVQLPEDLLCLDSKKAERKTIVKTQQRGIQWSLILCQCTQERCASLETLISFCKSQYGALVIFRCRIKVQKTLFDAVNSNSLNFSNII